MSRVFTSLRSPRTLLLAIIESALIALSLWTTFKLPLQSDGAVFGRSALPPNFFVQALAVVAAFQLCFCCAGLYTLSQPRTRSELLARIGAALGAGCLVLGLL